VISTNLFPILHRFRDIAFDIVQNRSIWLPLLRLTTLTEGFPCDDLRKIFHGCQRMAKVPNDVETLPKIQPNEYGARTLQTTDKQTTDGRAYMNVSSRSLKSMGRLGKVCLRALPT